MRPFLAVLLIAVLLPTAAGAVDTWEPYPPGPNTVEAYLTVYGFGSDEPDGEGSLLVLGPSWGLDARSHVSLYLGLLNPDVGQPYSGGLDFLSLVFFRNLYGSGAGPFQLDIYYQADAAGPGLSTAAHSYGLELNLDQPSAGLFFRPFRSVTQEMGEFGLEKTTNTHWTLGSWTRWGHGGQFLGEITGADDNPDGRHTSWAIGLNHPWGESLEIIAEYRYWPGSDSEDTALWDLSLGFVAVW